jgi:hypothetical protein
MSTGLRIRYGAAGEQEHEEGKRRTPNVEASFALSVLSYRGIAPPLPRATAFHGNQAA